MMKNSEKNLKIDKKSIKTEISELIENSPKNQKRRNYKFTPKRQTIFLEAVAEGFTVETAAKKAGIYRDTFYKAKDQDPDLKAAYELAREAGTDVFEEEAQRRALDGSDTLLIFILKARRPEIYKDKVQMDQNINANLTVDMDSMIDRIYGKNEPEELPEKPEPKQLKE